MNVELKIPDMSCSACGEKIAKSVTGIDCSATV